MTRLKKGNCVALLAAAVVVFSGCAPLVRVHEITPRLKLQSAATGELSQAGLSIAAGRKLERANPDGAISIYLGVVESAEKMLRNNPRNHYALRDYNFALSRVFSVIHENQINMNPWAKPLQLSGGGDVREIGCPTDPRIGALWIPSDYDFIPADQLSVGGQAFAERVHGDGLGAPLVAIRRNALPDYRKHFLESARVFYGITAVAHFEKGRCLIAFENPLATGTVTVGGHTFPLAADFSAAPAMLLASERPERLGLIRMLIPDRYAYTARLSRLEPFDPKKIPVLFVHGLQDTPATWALMFNTLQADPLVRRNYQFWSFSYPSGYPYPYSASLLRHELDAVHKAFPAAPRMVLVGHSMGGLICRLMVTGSGDKIWLSYFKEPPAQTPLTPRDKAILMDALIFKPRPEVARVIFISTPHHGSVFASNWIGRIVSSIVRTPESFVALADDVVHVVALKDPSSLKMKHLPNSIDTLAPNNRFLKLMNTLPIEKGVPYHSIMGDRGRGGDKWDSSDGVVAYRSSHIDGAQSEKLVPSGHAAHQNPAGIAEVDHILRLHLKQQEASSR